MKRDWLEIAREMAESARARIAADNKRLQEILAERRRKKEASTQAQAR